MFISLYYKVTALIVALIVWIGVVGPYCVSSTTDELVIGWFAVTIILAPLVIKLGISIAKNFIERVSNEA